MRLGGKYCKAAHTTSVADLLAVILCMRMAQVSTIRTGAFYLRGREGIGDGMLLIIAQSLIGTGAALPFTAHATSPTITMPRVKAITTGSIPSFLDVVLNFAEGDKSSSLANQDTWLAQMKLRNQGNLVMYGDDTWLKLFPDTFARADGTSSFFVSVCEQCSSSMKCFVR